MRNSIKPRRWRCYAGMRCPRCKGTLKLFIAGRTSELWRCRCGFWEEARELFRREVEWSLEIPTKTAEEAGLLKRSYVRWLCRAYGGRLRVKGRWRRTCTVVGQGKRLLAIITDRLPEEPHAEAKRLLDHIARVEWENYLPGDKAEDG